MSPLKGKFPHIIWPHVQIWQHLTSSCQTSLNRMSIRQDQWLLNENWTGNSPYSTWNHMESNAIDRCCVHQWTCLLNLFFCTTCKYSHYQTNCSFYTKYKHVLYFSSTLYITFQELAVIPFSGDWMYYTDRYFLLFFFSISVRVVKILNLHTSLMV